MARILVEFLEVAITSIVFLKRVYPAGAFERRRYMNAVVHRAKQPVLRDYIHSSVAALLPFIQKGWVDRVAVIFFNRGDNVVSQQFVVGNNSLLPSYSRGWYKQRSRAVDPNGQEAVAAASSNYSNQVYEQPFSLQLYVEHPSSSEPNCGHL